MITPKRLRRPAHARVSETVIDRVGDGAPAHHGAVVTKVRVICTSARPSGARYASEAEMRTFSLAGRDQMFVQNRTRRIDGGGVRSSVAVLA